LQLAVPGRTQERKAPAQQEGRKALPRTAKQASIAGTDAILHEEMILGTLRFFSLKTPSFVC
jgi:hypothetical protein